MIKLFGIPRSRSLRVSWTLEELQLDWQYRHINFANGDGKDAEFLAVNPCAKVPALRDGDMCLSESAAIVLYLAEKYGDGALLPVPGTAEAATHHKWVSYIISELEQPLWTIGKHKFALPEALRQQSMFAVAKWEFDKAAAIAESWVPESGYLLGERFSAADILLAHTLLWATRFEQDIPPKLVAYRDRVTARPAMQRGLDKEIAASQ
ncbi:glutathione S-transferase family protein [Shewanella sp. Scap07]|uniref:glutathione S-transferase family protein n=1 Tax=Shewanella sp. Scap07 TaxID=2589987 RepID=UPI0015BD53B2|nr:glutathione S-transferase family protein [Shewanella sp. Scap07]QLE86493.1 glutathione S-transferase family protein [Shewanella sp. Scap07]